MSRQARSFAASVLSTALFGVELCGSIVAAEHAGPLSRLFAPVGDHPLGEAVNRTDYESVDTAGRRLYIAKMGGGKLLVFDLDHNEIIAQLGGLPKVTGVLAVPELHKVYASVPGSGVVKSLFVGLGMAGLSRGQGKIVVIDSGTLKEKERLPGGVFPDGLTYDPKDHRIFVSDELGSAILVIDANGDKMIARIDAGGEVGNVRYDPITGRIYVPVQSHNELLAIDPAQVKVIARHRLSGCDHPHGFIVAAKRALGYIACDENDMMLTVDLANGHILNKQSVAHDPDVLAIDPEMNRLYVAGEAGGLSTFDIAAPDGPKSLGDVFVADGAHSVAVDPATHRLYFDLANLNGRAALRVLAPKAN